MHRCTEAGWMEAEWVEPGWVEAGWVEGGGRVGRALSTYLSTYGRCTRSATNDHMKRRMEGT